MDQIDRYQSLVTLHSLEGSSRENFEMITKSCGFRLVPPATSSLTAVAEDSDLVALIARSSQFLQSLRAVYLPVMRYFIAKVILDLDFEAAVSSDNWFDDIN